MRIIKNLKLKEEDSYLKDQLQNLLPIDEYGVSLKMSSTSGNTKYLTINENNVENFILLFQQYIMRDLLDRR